MFVCRTLKLVQGFERQAQVSADLPQCENPVNPICASAGGYFILARLALADNAIPSVNTHRHAGMAHQAINLAGVVVPSEGKIMPMLDKMILKQTICP